MLYRDYREWLAEYLAGCANHGTVQVEYVLRVLDQMIEQHEQLPQQPEQAVSGEA